MPGNASGLFNTIDTHETAQSLDLVISQIDMALKEADCTVAELIGAITSMACSTKTIEYALAELEHNSASNGTANKITNECAHIERDIKEAVIALQFYDRLSQRFKHIQENLLAVAKVIRAPDDEHPALWKNLRTKISSVYSLEKEQQLLQSFNAMATHSVTPNFSALSQYDNELF